MWRVNISTLCRQCLPFHQRNGRLGVVFYSTKRKGEPATSARNYEIGGIYSGVQSPGPQAPFLKALKDVRKDGKKGERRGFGERRGRDDKRDDKGDKRNERGGSRDNRDNRDRGNRGDNGEKGRDRRADRGKGGADKEKEWGRPIADRKGAETWKNKQGGGGGNNNKRVKKAAPFVIYKAPKRVEGDRGQFENTMFVRKRRPVAPYIPKEQVEGEIDGEEMDVPKSTLKQVKKVEVTKETQDGVVKEVKKEIEVTTFVNSMFKRAPEPEYVEEEEEEGEMESKEMEEEEEEDPELAELEEIERKKTKKVKVTDAESNGKKEEGKGEAFSKHIVQQSEDDMRMDRWVGIHFPSVPHSQLRKMLRDRLITYSLPNETTRKKAHAEMRVKGDYAIYLPSNLVSADAKKENKAQPVRLSDNEVAVIQSWVVHKDDDILVINKPEGLAVQGGTKVNRHLAQLLPALRFDKTEDPRLVHRLDRETSGALILARTRPAAVKLTEMFKTNKMTKVYWAIVAGVPDVEIGKINMPLEKVTGARGEERIVGRETVTKTAKPATTDFSVAEQMEACTFVVLSPNTGRTHQLRVHCASALKTPILGDRKYGDRSLDENLEQLLEERVDKLHLHARRIIFTHPISGKRVNVAVALPPHMLKTWQNLGLNPNYKEKLSAVATKVEDATQDAKVKRAPATYGNSKNVRNSIWKPKVSATPLREMKMKAANLKREKKEKRKKNAQPVSKLKKAAAQGKEGEKGEKKESKGGLRRKSRNAQAQEQKYRSSRRARPVRKLAPKLRR